MRERALPTLQNKESALRLEVKRAKDQAAAIDARYQERLEALSAMAGSGRVRSGADPDRGCPPFREKNRRCQDAGTGRSGAGGCLLQSVSSPAWFSEGVRLVRELAQLTFEREFFIRKMELLDFSGKKPHRSQPLRKVQIPGFEDAIRRIKRFLEDEENLSKSAQKIVKTRTAEAEAG